jgi:DNA-binding MarR family transcriptional regulator
VDSNDPQGYPPSNSHPKPEALLREVARLYLRAQFESSVCCRGITLTQCTVLTEVWRSGPLNLAALSKKLHLEKSWTSRAVSSLEQKNLLTKTGSSTDRRNVVIEPPPAGRRRCQQLNDALNAQAEGILARISEAERISVQRALRVLKNALIEELDGTECSSISCDTVKRRIICEQGRVVQR